MGNLQSSNLPKAEYWFYDHVLTDDQKTLFQTKITGNEELFMAIDTFCQDNVCEKEEIYNFACQVYDVAMRTESKDIRWTGEKHYLPKMEERFGMKQGTYLFEYIVMPLTSYLSTTKSLQRKHPIMQQITAAEIEKVLTDSKKPSAKIYNKTYS